MFCALISKRVLIFGFHYIKHVCLVGQWHGRKRMELDLRDQIAQATHQLECYESEMAELKPYVETQNLHRRRLKQRASELHDRMLLVRDSIGGCSSFGSRRREEIGVQDMYTYMTHELARCDVLYT